MDAQVDNNIHYQLKNIYTRIFNEVNKIFIDTFSFQIPKTKRVDGRLIDSFLRSKSRKSKDSRQREGRGFKPRYRLLRCYLLRYSKLKKGRNNL
jgi:hypothetical protein